MTQREPIVAIATAPGRGAVGIVRVSGPDLAPLVQTLCGQDLTARHATYLPFKAADGAVIDQGLALFFPAPHSYTGEDVLELQCHGGPVVLQLLLARCLEAAAQAGAAIPGTRLGAARLARPGEFTERAYLHGKLDLAQAEAVADLIDASTEAAARSASRSLSGAFSTRIHALLERLIHLRMLVEASLDFPEEDIDHLQAADAQGQLDRLRTSVDDVLAQTRQGALLREGIRVVIAGQPNAGKSSLLNALAGAELAIVTAVPGTTRDVIAQTIQIEGVPVHVLDTAGLRDSADEVERIGVARSWEQIAQADAVLFLHDLTRAHDAAYAQADAAIAHQLQDTLRGVPVIDVWNKADAVVPASVPSVSLMGAIENAAAGPTPDVAALSLSAKTGEGLDRLRHTLLARIGWTSVHEGLYMARERHVQALQRVVRHLRGADAQLRAAVPALDLIAEELRLGQSALGEITGEFTADDLLGEIFSRFCIGK